jgi:hypothetical protein
MKTMSFFRSLFPFFLAVGVLLWAQAAVADMPQHPFSAPMEIIFFT